MSRSGRRIPVRTCVGCRRRAPASELLRIVGEAQEDDRVLLVPDPARRRPGRGASLHADPACLALAERRRAFGRALRISGVIEVTLLQQYVARQGTPDGQPTGRLEETAAALRAAGDQQGRTTGHEHTMKSPK